MSTQNQTKGRRSAPKPGVTVRLDPEKFKQLEEIARRERRSLSGQAGLYVERALEEDAA